MALSQKQIISLQQKLSPQQIQMIKLLELPTVQLEQRIKQEIEDNIVLEAEERTGSNTGLRLNICLNYGGRAELVRAARMLAQEAKDGALDPQDITEETISQRLYTAGQPDVDLMIRTSGEMRLSNFLLYQCAYAEFLFPTVLWPDFTVQHYDEALQAYGGRERRFGKRL